MTLLMSLAGLYVAIAAAVFVVSRRRAALGHRALTELATAALVWPLSAPFLLQRAEDADPRAARLRALLDAVIDEAQRGRFASLEPVLRSLRTRVERGTERLRELDRALERLRGAQRGPDHGLERLEALRRREARDLEELERLLSVLRTQIALAHLEHDERGARELVDEVWARVQAFEAAFGETPSPDVSA